MDKINVVAANPAHKLPDAVSVFAKELDNILFKLRYHKEDSFNIASDSGQALVYYAIRMNYEYQRQGNGVVPRNIADNIWFQVLEAGKQVYAACQLDEFNKRVTMIYSEKLEQPGIISETIEFWERYELGIIE